jgi:hypothetical protein
MGVAKQSASFHYHRPDSLVATPGIPAYAMVRTTGTVRPAVLLFGRRGLGQKPQRRFCYDSRRHDIERPSAPINTTSYHVATANEGEKNCPVP